jgi:hypothetical protein
MVAASVAALLEFFEEPMMDTHLAQQDNTRGRSPDGSKWHGSLSLDDGGRAPTPGNAQFTAVVTQFGTTRVHSAATLDRPGTSSRRHDHSQQRDASCRTTDPLQMPAFALTWRELFAMAPAPYTGLQAGLARRTFPSRTTPTRAHLVATKLPDGRQIVRLMFWRSNRCTPVGASSPPSQLR